MEKRGPGVGGRGPGKGSALRAELLYKGPARSAAPTPGPWPLTADPAAERL